MNVEIASNLVKLRKKHGLSQEELAERIGVSRQAVSKWERAESSPDTDNLIALAKTYKLSLDEMINYDGSKLYEDTIIESGGEREITKAWLREFPIYIVAVMIFLLLGFIWHIWHPAWLVLWIVPIWHIIFKTKKTKKTP